MRLIQELVTLKMEGREREKEGEGEGEGEGERGRGRGREREREREDLRMESVIPVVSSGCPSSSTAFLTNSLTV